MSSAKPRTALLVVDVQEDFCPPNGSLAVPGGRDIAPLINDLLKRPFTLKIATRDFHPANHLSFANQHGGKEAFTHTITMHNPENPDESQETTLYPDHCVQGTPGCELIPELDTTLLDATILKGTDPHLESFSGFGPPFRQPRVGMTDLDQRLRAANVTRVFCVGLAYDVCVKCTAVDAVAHRYETFVIRDACRGIKTGEEEVKTLEAEYEKAGVRVITMDAGELPME